MKKSASHTNVKRSSEWVRMFLQRRNNVAFVDRKKKGDRTQCRSPEQDLAFKELLKRVKAWEDEKQMTFKGSLVSLCRNYMLSRPLACPLCGQYQ